MKPGKIEVADKNAKIYFGRSTTESFVLRSYTMHELPNQNVFIQLLSQSVVNIYYVLCTLKEERSQLRVINNSTVLSDALYHTYVNRHINVEYREFDNRFAINNPTHFCFQLPYLRSVY